MLKSSLFEINKVWKFWIAHAKFWSLAYLKLIRSESFELHMPLLKPDLFEINKVSKFWIAHANFWSLAYLKLIRSESFEKLPMPIFVEIHPCSAVKAELDNLYCFSLFKRNLIMNIRFDLIVCDMVIWASVQW